MTKNFWFLSTLPAGLWGGSEYLWHQTALKLLEWGHKVTVWHEGQRITSGPYDELAVAGARLVPLDPSFRRGEVRIRRALRQPVRFRVDRLRLAIQEEPPGLVVVTLGWHLDLPWYLESLLPVLPPYVINLQVASESDWMDFRYGSIFFRGAERVFSLSSNNDDILRLQVDENLENIERIDNPISDCGLISWPKNPDGRLRVAVVGRLHWKSKGQDLVLRALHQLGAEGHELEVTFFGQDQGDRARMEAWISKWGMSRFVNFGGFLTPAQIWEDYHVLLLPSRFEGLPMVTLEAMLCGRPAIVTCYGRNSELVDHERDGFLMDAPSPEAVVRGLRWALGQRDSLREIGLRAREKALVSTSLDAVGDFARRLIELA